ncbi:hypothetical protein GCM10010503_37320 [Streptomyces lucensis JCM 4490]|uniref:Uncharacterized protein n=1 Tax=Streptomyces lucensis JCM 4490 TaxID=1306176 RepID=A0A918J8D8_9ACTN|nr:hypothetical protein GCM10010503_37320 [Streptomyces lucensis JCM 4490]
MTGRPAPVAGAETRTWRPTGRPGTGRTTGLKDRTGAGVTKASGWVVEDVLTMWVPFRWLRPLADLLRPATDKSVRGVPLRLN